MGVIYKITSPSGKEYVGKTYNLKARIADYKCRSKKAPKKIIILNSINKYGWDAHRIEVVETVPDEQLNEREIFWIKELKTYCYENANGMNMTMGGDGQRTNWMHDLERRKYMSETFRGEKASFYGKHHTEENKIKASIRTSEYNKRTGRKVPKWGAEKGLEIRRRKILCYNSYGLFVKEFKSLNEAKEEMGFDHACISEVCSGKRTNTGGFVFRYKETDNIPHRIEVGELKKQTEKRPVLFLSEEHEIMAEYPSAIEASEELQVPVTSIRRASLYNYLWPIRTGHIFIYKDIFETLILD